MAHEVETMAYAGEVPWHGLGVPVADDLSPEDMLKVAGLDWEVRKYPATCRVRVGDVDKRLHTGKQALVRMSDLKILDTVGDDWNEVQNTEAFAFFKEFVDAGDMEMHTAGSLRGGQIVWALAKVKDAGFTLFGEDRVDAHLLFMNPHLYGKSTDIRFTPIRVVCNNTLSLSMNTKSKNFVKVSHRKKFDAEEVKATMGIATVKMAQYAEMAQFISERRFNDDSAAEYLKMVFPVVGDKNKKEMSLSAKRVLEILDTQPGAKFGTGTFWHLFNGVTYYVDHGMGRTADTRMTSAWLGSGATVKQNALKVALDMAKAA